MKIIDPIYHANLDIINDIMKEENVIYIKPGNYTLSQTIHIEKDNVRLIGLSENPKDVHIYQTNLEMDALNISAKNVTINGLSIHIDPNVNQICIGMASCHWCNITNCCFYGSNSHFTVFLAGPKHLTEGQGTLDAYVMGDLDTHNIFDGNVVYSQWDGDAISFSLQRYSCFRNNTLFGCKTAVYMTRDCMITGNIFLNSTTNGLFCSLPIENTTVENNLIKYANAGGIVIRNQGEHGEFISDDHFINIKKNVIDDCQYIGIEINDADDLDICQNIIINCHNAPIYMSNSHSIRIDSNKMINIRQPIIVDVGCNTIHVKMNEMLSQPVTMAPHAIKVLSSALVNIDQNVIRGEYGSEIIKIIDSTTELTSNVHECVTHQDLIKNENLF